MRHRIAAAVSALLLVTACSPATGDDATDQPVATTAAEQPATASTDPGETAEAAIEEPVDVTDDTAAVESTTTTTTTTTTVPAEVPDLDEELNGLESELDELLDELDDLLADL